MATVSLPTAGATPIELPLRRFDADEYMAMAEAGVFAAQRRVELIGGYVVDMSPAGAEHNYIVQKLNSLFLSLIDQFNFRVQGTLQVDAHHVVDPDFMLLTLRVDGYRNALPAPGEVALLVEVADSSRYRDANVKLPIYAAAGVAEYWIADIAREALVVHRQPSDKQYVDVREFTRDDEVSPLAAPSFRITANQVFG